MFNVAFLGAGRMGMTHLRNLVGIPGVRVRVVADVQFDAAERGAALVQAERASDDVEGTIRARDVDAVLIATPTPSHAPLIEACARAGKPVWCEKPVALTLEETRRVAEAVEAAGIPAMVGFMRRFDPGYAEAKRRIELGEVGRVERFRALSCDFSPPPLGFIRTSGGIFVDMLVHDFDLARFLVGEVAEVSAWGATLIDPGFAQAGDVDTAVALLRFENGALGVVEGARRTTWGYDIRTEVAGSEAKVVVEAFQKTPLVTSCGLGYGGDHFESFPDRFEAAYRAELAHFFDCLRTGRAPEPGVRDALESLRVALAATKSLQEGRPVRVEEIQ
ncbi:MAG TPA: inositol 2-dehydrogenase [Roseiflexaceae bacterium]|nr:inositol 2-dehydrogenase [Roseiflexaceae bacterium]